MNFSINQILKFYKDFHVNLIKQNDSKLKEHLSILVIIYYYVLCYKKFLFDRMESSIKKRERAVLD